MMKVTVLYTKESITIEILGHAGYTEACGHDLVCCGISAIAQAILHYLSSTTDLVRGSMVKKGLMQMSLKHDDLTEHMTHMLTCACHEIKKEYKEALKVEVIFDGN